MTFEKMDEVLKRLKEIGKELCGEEVPWYMAKKRAQYVPKHNGKIWIKNGRVVE